MGGRKGRKIPTSLARGRNSFQAWRRGRRRGTRIPERLWKLAVKLADAHGLSNTATVLKLDYYALKKRVESTNSRGHSAAPAFVELSPPRSTAWGECIVELEDNVGASMRVHLKGYAAPDLAALSDRFWSGK